MATCFLTLRCEVSSRLASNSNAIIWGSFESIVPLSNGVKALYENVSYTSKFNQAFYERKSIYEQV